jgi:hypothetical protein
MSKKPLVRIASAAGAAMLLATAVVAGLEAAPPSPAKAATHRAHGANRSPDAVRFRNQMRKLWEDHIIWTRQFIVSAAAGLPDTDTAAARLLANQDDIGDAIKPYYGDAAGEALSSLLRDHILIAADLLGSAKAGDQTGVEQNGRRWDDNAREIADFLSAANPTNWSRKSMRTMMAGHLEWTLNEAAARLNGDWDADVAAFDRIHKDILHMADMLSTGIIAQFPRRF